MNDLTTSASLAAGGFSASPTAQQRFLEDVVARRVYRLERATRPWLTFLGGFGLSVAGAALLLARGDMTGLWASGAAAVMHALCAGLVARSQRQRALPSAEPHPAACFVNDHGELTPLLSPGETVLYARRADGAVGVLPRVLASWVLLGWGLVLGGLPVALVGGARLGPLGLVVMSLGTFLGTYAFGRGVTGLLGMHAVERLVVTDQRIVGLFAPGVAQSLPLEALTYRPVVVAREAGRATLALGMRTLPATHPLPVHGLYGLFEMPEAEAKDVAGALMDARRRRLSPASR